MSHRLDNHDHSDRSSDEQAGLDSTELEKSENKMGERFRDRVKNSMERVATDPEVQKKVLALGLLVDLVNGSKSAIDKPNRSDINSEIMPKMSSVGQIENFEHAMRDTKPTSDGRSEQITATDKVKEFMVDMGQYIESVGSDESKALDLLQEDKNNGIDSTESLDAASQMSADSKIHYTRSLDEPLAGMGVEVEPPKAGDRDSFDQKVKDVPLEPITDKDTAESFQDGKYRTVEATEDIVLYRVYGGGSEKEGNPKSDTIFLTSREPTDRMSEKIDSALTNRWQGETKDENGETVMKMPNTREYYCEVYVPKGTHMNVGRAAPQETRGGQRLEGGGEQIVVAKDSVSFGEDKRLDNFSNYDTFERKAQKIEKETER